MYQNQRKFSGNLHALRGLAATAVIFYHAKGMNASIDVGAFSFVNHLALGVTLFFILSGFSLSLSNYAHIDKPAWLRGYSLKRIARIMPVWYSFIGITWLFQYFKYDGHINPFTHVFHNVIPFFALMPGRSESMVWAGWTIGVELMFYMVFPIMLVLFRNSLKAWGVALLALIYISITIRGYAGPDISSFYLENSFTRQAFIFVLGAALYFLTQRALDTDRVKPLLWLMLAIGGVSLGLVVGFYTKAISYPSSIVLVFQALTLGCLTVIAYINPKIGKREWFNLYNPVTKFLGDKSFTIYLTHPLIVSLLKPFYGRLRESAPNIETAYILYVAVVIAVSCLIATVISNVIEAPMYKLGRDYAAKGMTEAAERASLAQND